MKMTREQAKEQIKQGLSRLNDALAAGRSEELEHYLKTMSRFHRYSFNNIMLILMQNPEALHVAGFNAWKKLGRTVKKGEKGLAIVAPCRYKTKPKGDDQAEEGAETYAVRGFRLAYVFDISQTEGEELPELLHVNGEATQALARIKAYIEELGIELVYQSSMGPGCFGSSQGGTINVREDLDTALEFSILAHELAHEDLHHGERRNETSKAVRETEAEAVASVVCSAFGLDSSRTSADYINMHRGSVETLGESLQFIQRTAEKLIEGINAIAADVIEVTPKAVSSCNHTIECFDDSMRLQGSWATEETEAGTRVSCSRCQKFYGYVSAKEDEEEETEPLRIGRSDYEERQEERVERFHELAEKRGREANETHQEARRMASAIPFGQPILVGHHSEKRDRNYRERIHNKFGKAFELNDKAKYWENRAAAAESGNAISSDDPKAIEKLKAKLEELEQSQAAMKSINKAWRAAGKPGPEDATGWSKIAEHPEVDTEPEQVERLRVAYAQLLNRQGNSAPFPSYSLSNNNAEMRRIRERIKLLETSAKAEHIKKDCGVCRYVENPEANRVQLLFDGKPSAEIRSILKKNGFRFSKRDGNAWQRLLNSQGKRAVQWALAEIKKLNENCPA